MPIAEHQRIVITASTQATASGTAGSPIQLGSVWAVPVNAPYAEHVIISAKGLATTETVRIYERCDDAWNTVDKDDVPVVLDKDNKQVTLKAGPIYGVAKDLTAGAASVIVTAPGRFQTGSPFA